tara:strand:- start:383 stop:556 length:174 start_codon:yes stop_codon:yes gene_type:complete
MQVVDSALGVADEDETAVITHGGHSFVAAQQPLLPGLEPSAHVRAEGVGADGGPEQE